MGHIHVVLNMQICICEHMCILTNCAQNAQRPCVPQAYCQSQDIKEAIDAVRSSNMSTVADSTS